MITAFVFSVIVAVAFAAPRDASSQLKASFQTIDANHDGNLTLPEFFAVYDQYDKDGDGHLSLTEYLASTSVPKDLATPNFNNYDINKDGDISRDETRTIFSNFDENDDGAITLAEFSHHFSEIQKALHAPGVGK